MGALLTSFVYQGYIGHCLVSPLMNVTLKTSSVHLIKSEPSSCFDDLLKRYWKCITLVIKIGRLVDNVMFGDECENVWLHVFEMMC